MPNEVLNLHLLPNAVPAVPVAGWSNTNGGGLARINNGVGFYATNDLWAGWTLNSALAADGNGDYVVDITVTGGGALTSYSCGIAMLNSSGNGYLLQKAPYTAFLRRVTGGINGSITALASAGTPVSAINDVFTLKYNPTTGSLRAFTNGSQVVSTTDTTYNAATLFGSFMSNGYNNFTGIRSTTIYNVAAAPTLTIATALTPGASRTDACTEFSNGAATLSFSGVTVPVTIASGSFTWTVPMLGDGVVWPRLPATGQTITLTQGGKNANTTASINLPAGHQTLRAGDVVGGAVANFASIVTDNDRMLGFHFVAAANPLATTKTAYFVTSNGYWVCRNGDVGSGKYVDGTEDDPTPTLALPRTDRLYIQEANGLITAHDVTLSAAGPVIVATIDYVETLRIGSSAAITVSNFASTVNAGTLDGRALTALSSASISIPALSNGVASPRPGTRTLSLTDGIRTATSDRQVNPPVGWGVYTITADFIQAINGVAANYLPAGWGLNHFIFYPLIPSPGKTTTVGNDGIVTGNVGTQGMFLMHGTTGMTTAFNVTTTGGASAVGVGGNASSKIGARGFVANRF